MDDPADSEDEPPLVRLASLVVLGVGLTALFLGYGWFWLVFVVGFAVVVPMVKLAVEEWNVGGPTDGRSRPPPDATDAAAGSKQDALDALRDRYARGDLSDEEFERKVERLLETETPETAREHVSHERDGEVAREREPER